MRMRTSFCGFLATFLVFVVEIQAKSIGDRKVGWLLPTDNDCWRASARLALDRADAEFVTTKKEDTASSALKNMYKNGVRLFIGLNDGEGRLLDAYPDATFVSPFATTDEVRDHDRVVPVTISARYLAEVGMKKIQLLAEHNGVRRLVPVVDDETAGDWGKLYENLVPDAVTVVEEPVSVGEATAAATTTYADDSAVLFLPRTGLREFVDGLERRRNNASGIRLEVLAPGALFADEDVTPRPLNSSSVGVHTWFFLGDSRTELGRRALFKRLETKLRRTCPLTSAFVYDAALLAGSILNGGDSIQGTTGVLSPKDKVSSGDVATAFLRPADDRTTLQASAWILDGAYRVENDAVADLAARKFQTVDDGVFSRRTAADCHYFTPESLRLLRREFPQFSCPAPRVGFLVQDPLNYATTAANFTGETLPMFVVVPTAAGYEMAVACEDEAYLEVACPGLESAKDACTYKLTYRREGSAHHKRVVRSPAREAGRRRRLHRRREHRGQDGQQQQQQQRRVEYFDRKVLAPLTTAEDRLDLYKSAGLYEQKRIKPGFITRMLVSAAPSMMGCYGRLTGCIACINFRITIFNDPLFCASACTAGVGSFCGAAAGEMSRKYFTSFSVICTELFRQGKMSLSSYNDEMRFGSAFCRSDPDAMTGYQFLAKPVVSMMQQSETVTSVVGSGIAPWLRHARYMDGVSATDSALGGLMHDYGTAFAGVVGRLARWGGFEDEYVNCGWSNATKHEVRVVA